MHYKSFMFKMDENYSFSACFVLNSRKASRALTRHCDGLLRAHHITTSQFIILASLSQYGQKSVSELADILVIERTAMSRNLDLMVKAGLVVSVVAKKGNARMSELTLVGQNKFEEIYPIWLEVQQQLAELIYPDDQAVALKILKKLSNF